MRLRHIPAARAFVDQHPLVISEAAAEQLVGRWRTLWAHQPQQLALELGCGRGRFISTMAAGRLDVGFIGLELREEVLMQALERHEALPDNLRFLHANAQLLPTLFADGELNELYINFPDPWPKSRHDKRRLTAPWFISQYLRVLAPGGRLRFKTDNLPLFRWSMENFVASAFEIEATTEDLPEQNSGPISEYEARFRAAGQKICYVSAVKK